MVRAADVPFLIAFAKKQDGSDELSKLQRFTLRLIRVGDILSSRTLSGNQN